MTRTPRDRTASPRRPGTVYVFVLGIGVLLTVIGLAVVALVRLNTRLSQEAGDATEAEALAESAVEYALGALADDPNWRTAYTNGAETAAKSLGGGTFTFKLVDEGDGSLADDPMDNVRLYGYGRAGAAVRVYSVELKCKKVPLDVLRCAAHAAANVIANTTSTVSGGPLSSNASLTVPATVVVNGSVEAAVVACGGTVTGTITSGAPVKTMPPTSLYDTYLARATTISYYSLLSGTMTGAVLSPASNPYGSTNSEGIYYISVPALKTMTLTNSRLVATLVVYLNATAKLATAGNLLWETPSAGQPALIVRSSSAASVNLQGSSGWFGEAEIGVNLNPSGTPYNGVSDSDLFDAYPCEIRGLIHSIGTAYTVAISGDFRCRSPVICHGPMTVGGGAVLYASRALLDAPPEGYYTPGPMVPIAGTWRWEKVS